LAAQIVVIATRVSGLTVAKPSLHVDHRRRSRELQEDEAFFAQLLTQGKDREAGDNGTERQGQAKKSMKNGSWDRVLLHRGPSLKFAALSSFDETAKKSSADFSPGLC